MTANIAANLVSATVQTLVTAIAITLATLVAALALTLATVVATLAPTLVTVVATLAPTLVTTAIALTPTLVTAAIALARTIANAAGTLVRARAPLTAQNAAALARLLAHALPKIGNIAASSRRASSLSSNRPLKSDDPEGLPKPPEGWMDKDYYDRMETSQYMGTGAGRSGRVHVKVNGVDTKNIKYSFLEKLKTREAKFAFIELYGHPFARKVGIPYFNPYGHVPRDPKVVPRIPRPSGDFKLLIEVGAVGDVEWWNDVLAVMRSLTNELKPDASVLQPGQKSVTWVNFSGDLRTKLFQRAYDAFPIFYIFRDQTNKDCWPVREIARDFLSGSSAYDGKRKHIRDGTKRMRRNATKITENRAKQYTVPAREDDPWYNSAPAGGFNPSALDGKRVPLTKSRVDAPQNSTSKRDARRADKVVAEEEARDKAAASKSEATKRPKDKVVAKTGETPKAGASKPTAQKDGKKQVPKPPKGLRPVDSEEELLKETRDLLVSTTAQASITPRESSRLQVEVVSKPSSPPKRKAKDTLDGPPAKQQRLTGVRTRSSGAPMPIEADKAKAPESSKAKRPPPATSDKELERETPKPRPRPKQRPPPNPSADAEVGAEQLPKTPKPELEPEPEPEPEPESSKSPPDSNPPKKTLLENAELGPTTEKAAGEGAKSVTKGGQPSSELVHIDGQRVAKATKTKVPAQSDRILRSRAKK
ncbi:unnamed protein product [Rhizoctonia solani]|uniref:Uncharacterized protein n=1 Tax=Rhizoctonia solani TaxID=456999 RepID=A0A8H3A2J0_9AGAM|nr:unnamed protein product [Rhizoctonia solani]